MPQQNGVVERKNRTLIEIARTMLHEYATPKYFWAEAVNTACYMINRIHIRLHLKKTPYELWYGKTPKVSYFHVFGCKCYNLNTKDHLGKFDSKVDECIFLGYSSSSKAYRLFNKRTKQVEESIHVKFDESNDKSFDRLHDDEEVDLLGDKGENANNTNLESNENEQQVEQSSAEFEKEWRYKKDHPKENVIGDMQKGIQTRSSFQMSQLALLANQCFISEIEPKNVKEAFEHDSWIEAMHEELNQFERNNVWYLVTPPKDKPVIGTKWIFKNKLDEQGNVIRNKACLVAQGYTQIEGVDFDESFAPVARLESIRMLLAYACFKNFTLFQMDVKSAFLNGNILEDVFVAQPPGFQNADFPNHVFKLKKALYGLKQAPRAWYDRLSAFLLENDFKKGQADKTLFIKYANNDILVVQIYVDDIVFGATNDLLCKGFEKVMQDEFEMSKMGTLQYFLGFQVKQMNDGIFFNQEKYTKELLKRFNMDSLKPKDTPMLDGKQIGKDEQGNLVDQTVYRGMIGSLLYLTASRPDIMHAVCLCARYQASPRDSHLNAVKRIFRYLVGTVGFDLWYPKSYNFTFCSYSDSDFAGNTVDRKSTSGTCHFLGQCMISWSSRKQNCVALSTAEAEYIALGSCCAQSLWMSYTLEDFGINCDKTILYCDNTSAIDLSNNPIQHSRTKHIDVRYHFLRSHVESGRIIVQHVPTDNQLADIFTKPLKRDRFRKLRMDLGVLSIG